MNKLGIVAVFVLGTFMRVSCANFRVNSKLTGNACILMNIDASFYLSYTEDNHTQIAHTFDLKGASAIAASSQCGNVFVGTTSVLTVKLFPSGERLMFTFIRQNNIVDLSMRFTLDAKKHFHNMNSTFPVQLVDKNHLQIGAYTPNSYKCISEETAVFKSSNNFDLRMVISNLQVQAYQIKNNVFGPVIECNQDLATSTPKAQTSLEPQNETTTPLPVVSTTNHTSETTTQPPSNITTEPVQDTTTHSKSETTTQPEPKTTTQTEPETTSHSEPETSPHSNPETSSHSKPETSTKPFPETTTEHQSTSSMPISTTERPHDHKYVVRDKKEVCIVLQGNITFKIPFQTNRGGKSTAKVVLPDEVIVSGNCSYTETSQEITLAFFNSSWRLDIVIAKGAKHDVQNTKLFQVLTEDADYSWQSVTLTYTIDNHFPGAKNSGKSFTAEAEGTMGKFAAATGGSYKCNAEQDLVFGSDKTMKMDLSNMQYRAFGQTNSTDFSNSGVSKCPADDNNGGGDGSGHKTLGIALGCAFAGLVIIVFVACGITRYRKRKQELGPYDSIN